MPRSSTSSSPSRGRGGLLRRAGRAIARTARRVSRAVGNAFRR